MVVQLTDYASVAVAESEGYDSLAQTAQSPRFNPQTATAQKTKTNNQQKHTNTVGSSSKMTAWTAAVADRGERMEQLSE